MSVKGKMRNDYTITYTIDFENPVEIIEYTKSLNAFALEYKKFIRETYGSAYPSDAKLHIEKIREKCIETTLIEYSYLTLPFIQNINTVAEFGKHLKSAYDYFLGKPVSKPQFDIDTLNHLKSIVDTGTNMGNNVEIKVEGDNNVINVLRVNDIEANAVSNLINKEKKLLNQNTLIHEKQAFYFDQVKKNIGSKKGNYGIIENLYPEKLRVTFADDKRDKKKMLHGDHNPLKTTFIVDVEIQMVKEQPKIYKILKLHEIIEDED